ncbi:MAG TPA: hypothetical protein VFN51_01890 [Candidatus Saccharimonadales bacterium]|nr:hypothetical protein [Candidatus Saccharimonadales bacterium]
MSKEELLHPLDPMFCLPGYEGLLEQQFNFDHMPVLKDGNGTKVLQLDYAGELLVVRTPGFNMNEDSDIEDEPSTEELMHSRIQALRHGLGRSGLEQMVYYRLDTPPLVITKHAGTALDRLTEETINKIDREVLTKALKDLGPAAQAGLVPDVATMDNTVFSASLGLTFIDYSMELNSQVTTGEIAFAKFLKYIIEEQYFPHEQDIEQAWRKVVITGLNVLHESLPDTRVKDNRLQKVISNIIYALKISRSYEN